MTTRTEEDILREIGALITEAVALRHDDIVPFVTGWTIVAGAESTEWVENGTERTEYFKPEGQSMVTTVGLLTVGVNGWLE